MKFLAAVLFTWLSCVPAFATDIPSRIEISYNVKTDIGEGEIKEAMDITHTKNGLSYIINSEAQATGMFKLLEPNVIIRRSEGIITKKGLQPTKAYEKRGKMSPISPYLIGKNIWSRCSTMNRKSMKNYQRMESIG